MSLILLAINGGNQLPDTVSIVHDFVVAPCGGMTGKPIAQADRRFIDGAGLDNVRPLGGDLFRRRLTPNIEICGISVS
jgi:hypothetical protein